MQTRPVAAAALLAIAVILPATSARAQDAPSRFTVAAAGGATHPFDADFDFTAAPAWQISVRGQTASHLAIEGFFEQWTQQDGRVYTNQPVTGPDGPLGRIARVEQQTHYRMRTLGFNVLATGTSGRATLAAGGGARAGLHCGPQP